MAKKKKKIGKQCHEVNITRPQRKELTQAHLMDMAIKLERFRKENANDRLSTLASIAYMLKCETARITAEISVLLDDYGLSNGTVLKAIEQFEKAEDKLYADLQNVLIDDKENYKRMREDADRFDRDLYRYMGLPNTWKAGEPTQVSYTVGIQNFIGVGKENPMHGQNVYIGRNTDNKVWLSKDPDCSTKAILGEDLFPDIKRGEYYLMSIKPDVYLDAHR